jgi:ATPase family AAA domain-containing protein 3A/B
VLLFIDEAEAFLASRSNGSMSESAHNALNALLYNTGGERKDFMLVLATNRAEDLDAAVLDRCDESLFFDLPGQPERETLIRQYFRKYVVEAADEVNRLMNRWWAPWARRGGVQELRVDAKADGDWVKRAVATTDGMSGRELAKCMIGVQAVMYGGGEGKVSNETVTKVIATKSQEHKDKRTMMAQR